MSLHTWCCQGPCKPSSCATFTLNSHWGRATTGKKKIFRLCMQDHFGHVNSLQPCRLWLARLLCQGGGLSRQEYWSLLANTGCHTFQNIIFPMDVAINSPEYLVLPEPL